jgi:acyl-CoA hydrolase
MKKTASQTQVVMTQLVLPNDTNNLDNLRGGKLLHWMDLAAAVSAQKHCNNIVVTASVDHVSFESPIKRGDVVTLNAKVTRAFRTSMEVFIEVWAENIPARRKQRSNEAYFSFVALNDLGKPEPVPELIPESDEEKLHFEEAAERRLHRLKQAGRK